MRTGLAGAAIVVLRNNLHLSKACVESLKAQTLPLKILLINNASTDGTTQWARSWAYMNGAACIWYSQPISVAKAWNLGLKFTLERWDRALIVNNDTELRPDTFALLSHVMNSVDAEKIGLASGVTVRTREERDIEGPFNPSFHPDFSCFMLAREAYKTVGPFDEAFEGAYVEDLDYHVRMHRAGIRAVNVGVPFLHHKSSTINNADRAEVKRIQQNADRNRRRFMEKWGTVVWGSGYNKLFADELFGVDGR